MVRVLLPLNSSLTIIIRSLQVEKDHLQAELITEGSRKRRKIERQRRALLDTFKPTIDGPTEPPKERGRGRARKEEGPDKEKEEEEPVLSLKQVVKVALKHPYARLPTAPTANKVCSFSGFFFCAMGIPNAAIACSDTAYFIDDYRQGIGRRYEPDEMASYGWRSWTGGCAHPWIPSVYI